MEQPTDRDGAAFSPVPAGYHTVTPWLISRDTNRLLAFIMAAFAGEEIERVHNDDGSIGHAEIRIGDSIVMCFDAKPGWPETPGFLRLYVADGDETFRRALAAGGTAVTEMTELFWGDRVGRVRDPLGNLWWLQTRTAELTPEEIAERAADPDFRAAMRYVQGSLLFPS